MLTQVIKFFKSISRDASFAKVRMSEHRTVSASRRLRASSRRAWFHDDLRDSLIRSGYLPATEIRSVETDQSIEIEKAHKHRPGITI